jgi:hypothetical protein
MLIPWWLAWIFCVMAFIGGWIYGVDHERKKAQGRQEMKKAVSDR